jgi:hypothetical protein
MVAEGVVACNVRIGRFEAKMHEEFTRSGP